MNGVLNFVRSNFKSQDTYFVACIKNILFSYDKLASSKTYSREEIKAAFKSRGKRRIELEDYLRNDLICYLEESKTQFGLDSVFFIAGADEISNNIRTGILDIKVIFNTMSQKDYFVFECKRFDRTNYKKYFTEGVSRFIDCKYYPDVCTSLAGMIAFLESEEKDAQISIVDAKDIILDQLITNYQVNELKEELLPLKFIYSSRHHRPSKLDYIDIYHILLDYNSIVTA